MEGGAASVTSDLGSGSGVGAGLLVGGPQPAVPAELEVEAGHEGPEPASSLGQHACRRGSTLVRPHVSLAPPPGSASWLHPPVMLYCLSRSVCRYRLGPRPSGLRCGRSWYALGSGLQPCRSTDSRIGIRIGISVMRTHEDREDDMFSWFENETVRRLKAERLETRDQRPETRDQRPETRDQRLETRD